MGIFRRALGLAIGLIAAAPAASAEPAAAVAPTGRLRAAINYGNPVLAQRATDGGAPRGVSADLARELARRLGVDVAYVEFDSAGDVVASLKQGAWDVGFLAIDPKRGEEIAFSPAYAIIEGVYLVPAVSPIRANEDVDRAGVRIAVGKGSAYDLFLTREIRKAELVRAPTSSASIELFAREKLDVAAGVRQAIEGFARTRSDMRVLPGRFMTIDQAVAVPKGRPEAAAYVAGFVEEMKASGFVARGLAASGQTEAAVAPSAKR